MSITLDEAAAHQLHSALQESVQQAQHLPRPILTHLNADTTWLLSIPYPDLISAPPGRSRYNLLIDPWLQGPQEDVAGWFSRQWHVVKSSVSNIAELEQLLRDAENLERTDNDLPLAVSQKSYVDAVVISHEFTDHCHKATLLEIDPGVPVFATKKAARLIASWSHFSTTREVRAFTTGQDWRGSSCAPLPEWIGISRIITSFDALSFHSAVMICIRDQITADGEAEALIYTPHGVAASTLATLATASPPIQTLALIHGLHAVSIAWGASLNLGAINAVKAQRILQAKYWVGTHDEDKGKSGFIAPLLQRKAMTVAEALAQIGDGGSNASKDADGKPAQNYKPTCVELKSGESLLLA